MSENVRILIVDDDPVVAESLSQFLKAEGYATATAGDGDEAMGMIEKAAGNGAFSIVITDLIMPRCDGMQLLKRLRKKFSSIVPIVITGFGKIESAVEAVKLGAADYLTKPLVDDELRLAVSKAVNQQTLLAENATLRGQLAERFGMGSLVGGDYRMQKVYDLVDAVAPSKSTVLITGDSGTGKTLVARAIHGASERRHRPFVTFGCGSIPETLLESELFGHVKGSFTGADRDKAGKILAADGGTLFIDEINSATAALQMKLLRVLQEKQFEPVGSTQTITVDVRFILASNQSLFDLVQEGRFREDLYYRINVVNIKLPPLRERAGDVQLLAEHFLARFCHEMSRDRRFSEDAMAALQAHDWPGNVRELENAVERAVLLSKGPTIELADLPETLTNPAWGNSPANRIARRSGFAAGDADFSWSPMPLCEAMKDPERRILLAALEANNWNRQETARQLDINRTTLYKKIKQYGLDEPG
ncbi:MAG: sigma-54-dependent Fis family transcriptional regulator [Phycisphaeraceae bacterium]|nr:sigma-54-dependent Fis family transcriptional regulator [Phycisphaeraceae bacterium]